jgi:DNA repair photolyase
MSKKPVFGTSEWAAHNANIFLGCQHDCKYCYAKAKALRFGLASPESWSIPVLNTKAFASKRGKKVGTIMFPTTHDIHPDNLKECLEYLRRLLVAGNDVLVVTKPHPECIDRITEELGDYKSNILFRFTIGSMYSDILKFWEPNAPSFEKRFQSLIMAYDKGYQTSISCEPMLDTTEFMIDLFNVTSHLVTNSIWMGKANDLLNRLKLNGQNDKNVIEKANGLVNYWSDDKVWFLYEALKNEPKIRWKESIKKIVGIEIPTKKGQDI